MSIFKIETMSPDIFSILVLIPFKMHTNIRFLIGHIVLYEMFTVRFIITEKLGRFYPVSFRGDYMLVEAPLMPTTLPCDLDQPDNIAKPNQLDDTGRLHKRTKFQVAP
ncbi:MAG: hypothetical protein AAF702_44700 [Chloroflexota bacterium]